MMNEEAIKIIKQFRDRQGNSCDDNEAFDMAIKALEKTSYKSEARRWKRRYLDLKQRTIKLEEQQPSKDCISREAVKEMLTEEWTKYMPMELDINLSFVLEKISELPSVTPSRPKGKWIHWTDDYKDYVTCSCCAYGEEGEVLMKNRTPYCPICGTKMEGWADDE